MANEQYDTPSGNPPASPAAFALETLARACIELGYSLRARREVYSGLTEAERDVGLAREADRCRDVKHLAGEAEQLLRALVGFRSDREIQRVAPVRSSSTKRAAVLMAAVAGIITALAAAWTAIAGKGKP